MAKYWPFNRQKDTVEKAQSLDDRSWTRIFDWTPGAWQTHHPYDTEASVLAYPTVFACITLIQGDIAKLRPTIQHKQNTIWQEAENHEVTKLLRKPNNYQNHIQFKEAWISSKLVHGNVYVLKIRVGREIDSLHILDPLKVTPLVSDNGEVFYNIKDDKLRQVGKSEITVPATEIIHDRFNCLYHPLVGLSPIFAAGSQASIGLTIQKNGKAFFKNGSQPGGVLTAPGAISDATALRLKEYWEANFTGNNAGRVAALGDGLKYEAMRMSNVDAQVIQQLAWTDEKICSVFHVPAYKVGAGQMPTHNNIEALTQDYYSQCLQILIESMELVLDDGLNVDQRYRTQMDLDGLFRMDSATLVDTLAKEVGAGIGSPDEARRRLNKPPVPGGQYPYLQQQNYSLEALSQRDSDNPLGKPEELPQSDAQLEDEAKYLAYLTRQELIH